MIGGLFFTIGTVAALVMLGLGQRTFLWPAVAVAIFGLLPVWSDPGRLPPDIATIGDLVRRTASLNARIVLAAGGKPSSRWEILVSLAAEHGRLAPGEITQDTVLYRKSLTDASR